MNLCGKPLAKITTYLRILRPKFIGLLYRYTTFEISKPKYNSLKINKNTRKSPPNINVPFRIVFYLFIYTYLFLFTLHTSNPYEIGSFSWSHYVPRVCESEVKNGSQK